MKKVRKVTIQKPFPLEAEGNQAREERALFVYIYIVLQKSFYSTGFCTSLVIISTWPIYLNDHQINSP